MLNSLKYIYVLHRVEKVSGRLNIFVITKNRVETLKPTSVKRYIPFHVVK